MKKVKVYRKYFGISMVRYIFEQSNDGVKVICEIGSIKLSTNLSRSPVIRTKESMKKVKNPLNRKKKVTDGKLSVELSIFHTSVRRILKNDLLLRPYKKIVEPLLTDEHKEKRKKFLNCIRRRFRKGNTMKIPF